jgi:hypothetical protein
VVEEGGGSFGLGNRRGPEPLPLRLRDERLHPHVVARLKLKLLREWADHVVDIAGVRIIDPPVAGNVIPLRG